MVTRQAHGVRLTEPWHFHPAVAALAARKKISPGLAWELASQLRLRAVANDDIAGGVRHLRSIYREWFEAPMDNPYQTETRLWMAWNRDASHRGPMPPVLREELYDRSPADIVTLPHVVKALGGRAAFDGEPLTANPYAYGDARHALWEEGWAEEVKLHPRQGGWRYFR